MKAEMQRIASILTAARLPLVDEKRTQIALGHALRLAGVEHVREAPLSGSDIPDFTLRDGMIIEVKLKGSRKAVYRQLERYASHDTVRSIVLATARSMFLPESINGKPALAVSLSAGWL